MLQDITVQLAQLHRLSILVLQERIVIELIFITFYNAYHVLEVLLVQLVLLHQHLYSAKLVNSVTLVLNQTQMI